MNESYRFQKNYHLCEWMRFLQQLAALERRASAVQLLKQLALEHQAQKQRNRAISDN
jgi:hypothetical protein